jgi:ABC-type Fe3+ transport system permease subunit
MTNSSVPRPVQNDSADIDTIEASHRPIYWATAWTSLVFAVLQSVCTVLIGLGGARILISALSLAAATSVLSGLDWFHRDIIRIPMMLFACVGVILNLIVVAQVRMLRNRPSARWRLDLTAQAKKIKQERWQIFLSAVTIVLLAAEELTHWVYRHHG